MKYTKNERTFYSMAATTLIMYMRCMYFCDQNNLFSVRSLSLSLSVALCHFILSACKVFFILALLFTNNNTANAFAIACTLALLASSFANCNCNWVRSNNLLTRKTRPLFGFVDAQLDSWIIHLNKIRNKSSGEFLILVGYAFRIFGSNDVNVSDLFYCGILFKIVAQNI